MAFFCKVLLLQSQKLKKGSWIAVRWGPFELSVCHTVEGKWGETDGLKQPTAKCWPFPPEVSITHPLHLHTTPKWESQYEVMECILCFDDWKLKLSTVSSSTPHPIPSPSFLSSWFPCWGRVISDQRPVGNKDVDFESGAMGEVSKSKCTLPYAFSNPSPFRNVWLIRLNLWWLPSLQQTIHLINIK